MLKQLVQAGYCIFGNISQMNLTKIDLVWEYLFSVKTEVITNIFFMFIIFINVIRCEFYNMTTYRVFASLDFSKFFFLSEIIQKHQVFLYKIETTIKTTTFLFLTKLYLYIHLFWWYFKNYRMTKTKIKFFKSITGPMVFYPSILIYFNAVSASFSKYF